MWCHLIFVRSVLLRKDIIIVHIMDPCTVFVLQPVVNAIVHICHIIKQSAEAHVVVLFHIYFGQHDGVYGIGKAYPSQQTVFLFLHFRSFAKKTHKKA